MRQRSKHRLAPAPAAARHRLSDRRGIGVGRRRRKLCQQDAGCFAQEHGRILEPFCLLQADRRRDPARRRQAEPSGPDEGKELEEVQGREGRNAETPRRRPIVHQHRRLAAGALGGLGEAQRLDFAVEGKPRGGALSNHQRRRCGQQHRTGRRRCVGGRFHASQSAWWAKSQ
jgi:hypothetical protein